MPERTGWFDAVCAWTTSLEAPERIRDLFCASRHLEEPADDGDVPEAVRSSMEPPAVSLVPPGTSDSPGVAMRGSIPSTIRFGTNLVTAMATENAANHAASLMTPLPTTNAVTALSSNRPTFHRRTLPAGNIAFSSARGQQMFKEGMNGQNGSGMGCFFRLIEQFRTQDEPAFCGLSTLTMVLNALNVDPGKTWKGPWRWFHESMLSCCEPIEAVKEKGITWPKFLCLARCNGLAAEEFRCMDDSNMESFRRAVMKVAKQDTDWHETDNDATQVLVVSYSRKAFGQTGDGHYSPIGGYHRDADGAESVLILDVARFKYPPHWVPLELMYEAMKREDKDTGKPRGFLLLKRKKQGGWLTLVLKEAEFGALQDEQGLSPGLQSGQLNGNGGVMSANEVPKTFVQVLQQGLANGQCNTALAVASEAFALAREFCRSTAMPLTIMCYEATAARGRTSTRMSQAGGATCRASENQASGLDVHFKGECEARACLLNALGAAAKHFAQELGFELPDDAGLEDDCFREMSPAELDVASMLTIPPRLWEDALPEPFKAEAMDLLRSAGLDEERLEEALQLEVETLRYQFHEITSRSTDDMCCSPVTSAG